MCFGVGHTFIWKWQWCIAKQHTTGKPKLKMTVLNSQTTYIGKTKIKKAQKRIW
jgi:hypothetical protein